MSIPLTLIGSICLYFAILIIIGYITGRNANAQRFFLAGKNAPWFLVAVGMVGSSISGVTFISIPGVVGTTGKNMGFSYMQMVLGYLAGYFVIVKILLPIYYKYQLTSIYTYLEHRFGVSAQKTGSGFFILSRLIQSAFRLYLVAMVIDVFVTGPAGVPFWATVAITIVLIYVYTFKGGVQTIIWTDPLQTIVMIGAVLISMYSIASSLDSTVLGLWQQVLKSNYSKIFFFESGWSDPNYFFKQFLAGALITIVMTGLDQDMMQKNLSCRTLTDAQKNMITYSLIIVLVNFVFLSFGAMLYFYIDHFGIEAPAQSDQLYPTLAFKYFPTYISVIFILGLTAAAYSSADSALTALTTSFYIDILGYQVKDSTSSVYARRLIHILFALILGIFIVLFHYVTDEAVITSLFEAAGYTYGPLLGLFVFGLFSKRQLNTKLILPVCIISPILTYCLNHYSALLFGGFQFGFTLIALNGILTILGLWTISYRPKDHIDELFK